MCHFIDEGTEAVKTLVKVCLLFFLLHLAGSGTHRDPIGFQMEPKILSPVPGLSNYFFLEQIRTNQETAPLSVIPGLIC